MKFSIRQILASVAGAVLAAVIASVFGVKGTIVGVAIGSAAATFGTALVAQSIERTHEAVKQVVVRAPEDSVLRRLGATAVGGETVSSVDHGAPTEAVSSFDQGPPTEAVLSVDHGAPTEEVSSLDHGAPTESMSAASSPPDETTPVDVRGARGEQVGPFEARAATSAAAGTRLRAWTGTASFASRRFTWKAIAGTAGIVFLVALLVVTGVELIAGKPLSSIFGHAGSGTSVGNIVGPPPASPVTTTTTTPSPTTTTSTSSSSSSTSTTTSTTTPSSSTSTSTSSSASTSTTTAGSSTTTTSPTATTSTTGVGASTSTTAKP